MHMAVALGFTAEPQHRRTRSTRAEPVRIAPLDPKPEQTRAGHRSDRASLVDDWSLVRRK